MPEICLSGVVGNGYMMNYMNVSRYDLKYFGQNVDHADYMKLRSLTLGYKFTPEICRFIGVSGMSIRLQMNNVCTWVRNKRGIDPARVEASSGTLGNKIPKSYTVSLNVNI